MNYLRVAPSLGALEGDPNKVWGTSYYQPEVNSEDPTVFFGLYGLPDFYSLWRHRGKKWILWAGSDIRHFTNGYWLDEQGSIRIDYRSLAKWINKNCDNWVENEVEAMKLKEFGIKASICPSFMGDVNDYEITYKHSDTPKIYASVSGDDFKLYGWDDIEHMAKFFPTTEFHLYGNTKEWKTENDNVFVHGRVPKEQMNEEIKNMQGGLRPVEFDGFSEILAKSVLWGQWPISLIDYPYMLRMYDVDKLKTLQQPNHEGRSWYLNHLNNYPWREV